MAATHGDCSVVIYCPTSGKTLANCIGHQRPAWTLDFHSRIPYLLATGGLDGDIRLWNLERVNNDRDVDNLTCLRAWRQSDMASSIALHPTQPILAAAQQQDIIFYDWYTGSHLSTWRFVSNHSRVRWLRFNAEGTLLYSASGNPQSPKSEGLSLFNSSGTTSVGNSPNLRNIFSMDNEEQLTPPRPLIASHALLPVLMAYSDHWFSYRGICDTCPIRICRWAACLGSRFPLSHSASLKGLSRASVVARSTIRQLVVGGLPLRRTARAFANKDSLVEISWEATGDPHPNTVAIIEDTPVREFLESRGGYCSKPSVSLAKDGEICCGAHAYDLVLLHRELMRHSVCRSCLAIFWRWALRWVNWWPEGRPAVIRDLANESSVTETRERDDVELTAPSETAPNTEEKRSPVGLCSRCHRNEVGRKRSVSQASASSDRIRTTLINLELLRARLRNTRQVTPLTFKARDVLMKGKLGKYIDDFFKNAAKNQTLKPRERICVPTRLVFELLNEDALSPNKNLPPIYDRLVAMGAYVKVEEPVVPEGTSIILKEIEQLDPGLLNDKSLVWNHPTLISPSQFPPHPQTPPSSPLKIFDFASVASRLLRLRPEHFGFRNSSRPSQESSDLINLISNSVGSTSACCRCGCIVSDIVPIDPRSDVGGELCKEVLLSDHSGPTSPKRARMTHVPSTSSVVTQGSSDTTTSSPSLLSLIGNVSGGTLLDAVQQTVTEVVSGLLADMGEHSSASKLRNCTHRVCCWKFNLYGPVYNFRGTMASGTLRPMPVGLVGSYASENLIAPHVLLFNDSSIRISPDGRHLATFISPKAYTSQSDSTEGSSKVDTTLAVFRLQPDERRGQCVFLRRFNSSSPVCLDFSPLSDYLAVGMAMGQLPVCVNSAFFTAINDSLASDSQESEQRFFVAQVFRLREFLQKRLIDEETSIPRTMFKTGIIRHPSLLNPISCSRRNTEDGDNTSSDPLEHWHRLLLSTPSGVSLNSILWNPNGGLVYGTTKGLVILMKTLPSLKDDDSENGEPPPRGQSGWTY